MNEQFGNSEQLPPDAVGGGDVLPRLDNEAPARIWLQIDTAGDNDERDVPWPGSEHVTWQDESIGGLEVEYVRANSAARQPAGFDRARETPCRQTAVELLLSMGYVWATDHWEARKPADAGSGGDAPIDVTDPWRGLYLAERLRAHTEYGDVYHPDIPSWPDDREDALDKLVHAQGFDFQILAGDFSEEAMEDGDELYWQEMRDWNPIAPDGEWRLAWKGDTEDGPYAWFVRPMALRPAPEALATRQTAQGGTVTGWRMINGVTVFDVASNSGIVEPQQFVRYADYLAARQPAAAGGDA